MPPVPPAPMESCTTIDLLLIAVCLAQIKSHTKVPVCMQVPTTRLGHKTLFEPVVQPVQSAFFVVRGEDLPRATFAKTIESIVEPLFSPAHFPAQGTSSAVWQPVFIFWKK